MTEITTRMIVISALLMIASAIPFTKAGVLRIDEAGSKVLVQRSVAAVQFPNIDLSEGKSEMAGTTTSRTMDSIPTNSSGTAISGDVGDEDKTAETEAVTLDEQEMSDDAVVPGAKNEPKSASLLLLSVPKNSEKPKELEENIKEPEEESEEGGSSEESTKMTTATTEISDDPMTTTVWPPEIEDEEENAPEPMSAAAATAENDAIQLTTFDQLSSISSADQKTSSESKPKNPMRASENQDMGSDDPDAAIPERQDTLADVPNDKFGATYLLTEEVEPDFVLLEGDDHSGSFTHVDSEEHLQPIVESVEIVPSTVDHEVIVSYVNHPW